MINTPLGEIHERDQQEARILCDQLGISSTDTELVDYIAYGLHRTEADVTPKSPTSGT